MSELRIAVRGTAVCVDVLVTPRASRSAVAGVHDGRLKVQLAAPPVDGAANRALTVLLARKLGVKQRDIAIVNGATSRKKTVAISGTSEAAVRALSSVD